MLSAHKYREREKNSDRKNERECLPLNLEVNGSPIPIYAHLPRTPKEYKTYKRVPKERKRKTLAFPLDKIIYLSERLELTSLTEKQVKSVSLSTVDIKATNSLEEIFCCRDDERKQNEPLDGLLPPAGFDFSLDLSSVTNTGDESEEGCDDSESETLLCNSESSNLVHWVGEPPKEIRPARCSYRNFPLPDAGNAHAEGERLKRGSCDLVNVYMNSVNNQKDLARYLRMCSICKELSCVCASNLPSQNDVYSTESLSKRCMKTERDIPFDKITKSVETDASLTKFSCECANVSAAPGRKPRDFECCLLDTHFLPPFCKEECRRSSDGISLSASSDSVGSDWVLSYTSSLANAARSARVLARDLELILSTLNREAN